jgi:hypothetical protein
MHIGENTMKISELLEARDTHCSDKCCGSDVKAEDCKCPPTCKHCNCNAKNKMDEGWFGFGADAIGADRVGAQLGGEQTDMHTIARRAKDLKDGGMSQQQVIQTLQDQFNIGSHFARQAIALAGSGVDISETTSAGSVAAVAGGMGTVQKRNMYNTDGTMKNALDTGDLLGGATPSSKKKKSSKKA